jgi:hypothetical protein
MFKKLTSKEGMHLTKLLNHHCRHEEGGWLLSLSNKISSFALTLVWKFGKLVQNLLQEIQTRSPTHIITIGSM